MNSAIEFHDSEVGAISREGGDVIVCFTSAYIHKSEGKPGYDAGTGWVQPAELIIGGGSVEGIYPDFPCWVADGALEWGDMVLDNLLPLPFECAGKVKVELMFTLDSTVTISGERAVLNLIGEATYVEDVR